MSSLVLHISAPSHSKPQVSTLLPPPSRVGRREVQGEDERPLDRTVRNEQSEARPEATRLQFHVPSHRLCCLPSPRNHPETPKLHEATKRVEFWAVSSGSGGGPVHARNGFFRPRRCLRIALLEVHKYRIKAFTKCM